MIPREKGMPVPLLPREPAALHLLVYYGTLAVSWIAVLGYGGFRAGLVLAAAVLLVHIHLLVAAGVFAVPYIWWLDGRPGWLVWAAVGMAAWIRGVTWLRRLWTLHRQSLPVRQAAPPWHVVCDHAPGETATAAELLTSGQPERALQHCLELLATHPTRTPCHAALVLTAAQAALDSEAPDLAVTLARCFLDDDDRSREADSAAGAVLARAQAESGDVSSAAAWAAAADRAAKADGSADGDLSSQRFVVYTLPVIEACQGVHDEAEGFMEALARPSRLATGAVAHASVEALPFLLSYGNALLATGHPEAAAKCFSWVVLRTSPGRYGPAPERLPSLKNVGQLEAWTAAARWWALAVQGLLDSHPEIDLAKDEEARAETIGAVRVLALLGATGLARMLARRLPSAEPASSPSALPGPLPWMLSTESATTVEWEISAHPEPGTGATAAVSGGLELFRALYDHDPRTGIRLYRQALARTCVLLLAQGRAQEALVQADQEAVLARRSLDMLPLLTAQVRRADCLAALGRPGAELVALRSALAAARELPSERADRQERIAALTRRTSGCLEALGRSEECIPLVTEEIDARRALAAEGRIPDLAAYADTLARAIPLIAREEDHQQVVDLADDLVTLSRRLTQMDSAQYSPSLRQALGLLAGALESAGAVEQRRTVLDELRTLREAAPGKEVF